MQINQHYVFKGKKIKNKYTDKPQQFDKLTDNNHA